MALGICFGLIGIYVCMRRGKQINPAEYIRVRMSQLFAEAKKCHDDHDKQWYNRCARELHWVLNIIEKEDKNGTN